MTRVVEIVFRGGEKFPDTSLGCLFQPNDLVGHYHMWLDYVDDDDAGNSDADDKEDGSCPHRHFK